VLRVRFCGCSGSLPVMGSEFCAGEVLLGDYGAEMAPGELGCDRSVVWGRASARDGCSLLVSVVLMLLMLFWCSVVIASLADSCGMSRVCRPSGLLIRPPLPAAASSVRPRGFCSGDASESSSDPCRLVTLPSFAGVRVMLGLLLPRSPSLSPFVPPGGAWPASGLWGC
jgi:hypothetical protein